MPRPITPTTPDRRPSPARTAAAHRAERIAARRRLERLSRRRRRRWRLAVSRSRRAGRTPRTALLRIALLVLALGLAACGSGEDRATDTTAMDSGSTETASDDAGGADDFDVAEDDGSVSDGGATAPAGEAAPEPSERADDEATSTIRDADRGRRIIRTAYIELDAADTAVAAQRITAIARDAGGFIAETDLQRDRDGIIRGSITLRVPSRALFDTVEALDELAVAVPTRRIDERDVTAQSVDLEASRRNLIAYEQELTELLGDVRGSSSRASDLLEVFERIRSVRAEIDRIDAQRAVLDDQVALATIEVLLRPASTALPVADTSWSLQETVRDALGATARGLTAIADVAIRLVLTVVPIAALLALPVAVPLLLWRRHRAGGTASPPPPPSAPPGSGDPAAPPGGDPTDTERVATPTA